MKSGEVDVAVVDAYEDYFGRPVWPRDTLLSIGGSTPLASQAPRLDAAKFIAREARHRRKCGVQAPLGGDATDDGLGRAVRRGVNS